MIANKGISLEAHILSGLRKVHRTGLIIRTRSIDTHLGPDLIVRAFDKWDSRALLWAQESLINLYSKASRANGNGFLVEADKSQHSYWFHYHSGYPT